MIVVELSCIAALLALAVIGACAARARWGRYVVYGGSLVISLVVLLLAVAALPADASEITLPIGLPWIGACFRVDPLAAFFLVVIGIGGAATSLYAIGYSRHDPEPQRILPFYPAFLAGLSLVVVAADAFTFLFAWEGMSLASWALVVANNRDPEATRAGYIYLVMAAFSGLVLLLCLGLLAGASGAYSFAAIRAAHLPVLTAAVALVLALIGAGSKAGLVPLHAWLPLAHPAAPSPVSALMSGVMTKVAVYGFIRIVFDLLGTPTWWSAVLILLVGSLTAVLGILHALMERDIKRLLAYSTVENIGIVFIGLGLAQAFSMNGLSTASALALTAALFHVFNHSLFKSLLFQGAGAVMQATGERDMDRLGGLIHRMPWTAGVFLLGCMAISALPPLNGFVSEWLTFQAILLQPNLPQWGLKIAVPADGALLGLAAALVSACFVKVFGLAFLGRARSTSAAEAREVDRCSLAAMFSLAALCLLVGIFPGAVIDSMAPVTMMLLHARMPVQLDVGWLSVIPVAAARSSYNGLLIFLFIALSVGLAALAVRMVGARRTRRAPAWDCGFPDLRPVTQYTGDSFAQPIRRVFGAVAFRARETVHIPSPGDTAAASIDKVASDPIWTALYLPIAGATWRVADVLNHLQFLTIRRYLALIFAALVTMLLALALWQ